METPNLDLWKLIHEGAISTYPLLACSVVVLGVTLERIFSLRGLIGSTTSLTQAVLPHLAAGDPAKARAELDRHPLSSARRIFTDVLAAEHGTSIAELDRIAEERQFEEIQGANAYLWIIATIGSSAPFIGLFGTVLGIMRAFHSIALVGTGGFGVVAGGISEALIATALGILVGIIAVAIYNYFQARVERIDAALRVGSARVIESLSAQRRAHGA